MDPWTTVRAIEKDENKKRMEFREIKQLCKKNNIEIPEHVENYIDSKPGQKIASLDCYEEDLDQDELDQLGKSKEVKYLSKQEVEIDIEALVKNNIRKISVRLSW